MEIRRLEAFCLLLLLAVASCGDSDPVASGSTFVGGDDDDDGAESNGCGSSSGDGETLTVQAQWKIPSYATGAPSVFTDLYVSGQQRLFLVNDQQQCEIALVGGAPDFDGSGSFCALTQGFSLRGWTRLGGIDHVVDADSRAILSGNGEDSYPLPAALGNPSGLACDGERFWISDEAGSALWVVDPGGEPPFSRQAPAGGAAGVGFDGKQLWVLLGRDVVETALDGSLCRSLSLGEQLSGFSVEPGSGKAWGVDAAENRLYRYQLSND
jgi:hypothetical protein